MRDIATGVGVRQKWADATPFRVLVAPVVCFVACELVLLQAEQRGCRGQASRTSSQTCQCRNRQEKKHGLCINILFNYQCPYFTCAFHVVACRPRLSALFMSGRELRSRFELELDWAGCS